MSNIIIAPWEDAGPAPPPRDFLFVAELASPAGDAGLALAASLGFGAVALPLDAPLRCRREDVAPVVRTAEAAAARGLRVFVALEPHGLEWTAEAAQRFGDLAELASLQLGHVARFLTLRAPLLAWREEDARRAAEAAASAHVLAMQAIRATSAAAAGLRCEAITARPLGRGREDEPSARFVEAARSIAWLRLGAGREGLSAELASHGATTAPRARLLAATDRPAPASDFAVVDLAEPVQVAARAGAPFGCDVRPASGDAPDPWMRLVALQSARAEADPPLFVLTPGDASRLEDDAESWKRALAAKVPLAGWIVPMRDGASVIPRIVERW